MDNSLVLKQFKMAIRRGDKQELSEIVQILRNKRRYTATELKLIERIQKGKVWLEKNGDSPDFEKNLKHYQNLVDELANYGVSEEEAWIFNPMSEVSDYFEEVIEK